MDCTRSVVPVSIVFGGISAAVDNTILRAGLVVAGIIGDSADFSTMAIVASLIVDVTRVGVISITSVTMIIVAVIVVGSPRGLR